MDGKRKILPTSWSNKRLVECVLCRQSVSSKSIVSWSESDVTAAHTIRGAGVPMPRCCRDAHQNKETRLNWREDVAQQQQQQRWVQLENRTGRVMSTFRSCWRLTRTTSTAISPRSTEKTPGWVSSPSRVNISPLCFLSGRLHWGETGIWSWAPPFSVWS